MSNMITSAEIHGAIKNCLTADPPREGVFLSRDASLLADILGGMIARRMKAIDRSVLQGEHLEAFNRWRDQV